MGPEGSRRARAFAIWATLRAYGRSGYRADGRAPPRARAAPRRAGRRASPSSSGSPRRRSTSSAFAGSPQGAAEDELDELNRGLGEALLRDGRVFAGTTVFEGKVAFRPAIVNWRTRAEDVDALVDVLLELASDLRS